MSDTVWSALVHKALTAAFAPERLVVSDESAAHTGHEPLAVLGGSHFSVLIVSEKFCGMDRLARHRAVYGTLADLLGEKLHAVTIKALTSEESRGHE